MNDYNRIVIKNIRKKMDKFSKENNVIFRISIFQFIYSDNKSQVFALYLGFNIPNKNLIQLHFMRRKYCVKEYYILKAFLC